MNQSSKKTRWPWIAAYFLLLLYLPLEGTLSYNLWLQNYDSYGIYETPAQAVTYSAESGYRWPPVELRFSRRSHGVLENVGSFRGNNWGYSDSRDFVPKQDPRKEIRVAIFGDSMTAATFLEEPWPRKLERIAKEAGFKFRAMNFSLDGITIMNWRQMIVQQLAKNPDFDADIYVFAPGLVTVHNRFIFATTDDKHLTYAEIGGKDLGYPISVPKTPPQNSVKWQHVGLVNSEQYELELRSGLRESKFESAVIRFISLNLDRTHLLLQKSLKKFTNPPKMEGRFSFSTPLKEFLFPIRTHMQSNGIESFVAFVPFKRSNFYDPTDIFEIQTAYLFSLVIGAQFIDGRTAFHSVPSSKMSEYWYQYDGHWRQKGSDLFAELIFTELRPTLEKVRREMGL